MSFTRTFSQCQLEFCGFIIGERVLCGRLSLVMNKSFDLKAMNFHMWLTQAETIRKTCYISRTCLSSIWSALMSLDQVIYRIEAGF